MLTRWRMIVSTLVLLCIVGVSFWTVDLRDIPSVRLDYGHHLGHVQAPGNVPSSYNGSKLALLIEDRSLPHTVPLLLHFISVIPSDWRVRFLGSETSTFDLQVSSAIRSHTATGKLEVAIIPEHFPTNSAELISRFLTNIWVYETLLAPTEWLLIFQTDSILCGASERSLNDWLEYDYVGAPWHLDSEFGGNGGLSLRRVSAVLDVLRQEERKFDDPQWEDMWLSNRLGARPGAKMANGTLSQQFSVETWWTERPMGFHLGASGELKKPLFGDDEQRKAIYEYCPEIKIIIDSMDATRYCPQPAAPQAEGLVAR